MKWIIPVAFLVVLASCSSRQGIFSSAKKSPHESYGSRIEDAGLKNTSLGMSWFSAAEKSLRQPASITLPFEEKGFFSQSQPRAAGYRFTLRRGEKVQVQVTTVPAAGLLVFCELWMPNTQNQHDFLAAADTTSNRIEYEIEKDGPYVLRIQSELLKDVEYSVRVTTAPSLAFPVRQADQPKIMSFWGANRDGGSRSHEGVDIFAKKRTPLVAAADGTVSRVNENNLGGKVVFLRPDDRNYSLYYAHLDTQMVSAGQRVKTGDVLGLMGNTGNARTTPAHLHFGIYAQGGAIDPLPFIETSRGEPKPVTAALRKDANWMRTAGAATVYEWPALKASVMTKTAAGDIFEITGATDDWYRLVLADGREGYMPARSLTSNRLREVKVDTATRLLSGPMSDAPARKVLPGKSKAEVLGVQNGFYRVRVEDEEGWIQI